MECDFLPDSLPLQRFLTRSRVGSSVIFYQSHTQEFSSEQCVDRKEVGAAKVVTTILSFFLNTVHCGMASFFSSNEIPADEISENNIRERNIRNQNTRNRNTRNQNIRNRNTRNQNIRNQNTRNQNIRKKSSSGTRQ